MRIFHYFLLMLSAILIVSCQGKKEVSPSGTLIIVNPTDQHLEDAIVRIPVSRLSFLPKGTDIQRIAFTSASIPVAFQWNDLDQDGASDEVLLCLKLEGGEEKTIEVRILNKDDLIPPFPKRTQAEISHKFGGAWKDRKYLGGEFRNVDRLAVPPEHTDHSEFIRYEGPGWESDKVGYRFYLDWRNANDIFGKKTDTLVLQKTGLDGFDSYHEMAPWGMDILKVGESLGIGSIATYSEGIAQRVAVTDSIYTEILSNGILESRIRTRYSGWKTREDTTDLTADLWIQAGSRLTGVHLRSGMENGQYCTGLVKLDSTEIVTNSSGMWGYLASYGKQSLAGDLLGMAILYPLEWLDTLSSDAKNHLVIFQPGIDEIEYYFLAAWEKEPGGIANREAFLRYMEEQLNLLNQRPGVKSE